MKLNYSIILLNTIHCFEQTYDQPDRMTIAVVENVKEKVAVSFVKKNYSQFNSPDHCYSNHN
ncbi:MAG: hypothetical protein ACQJCO_08155 [cyanobacterium endosymbiont of Rhopalodia sterrenbergii]